MTLNLDQIEQDLAWARDNADRSAQTRLFVHHVPAMLVVLRAHEVSQAQGDEAEQPEVETQEEDTSGVQVSPDAETSSEDEESEEDSQEDSDENPGGSPVEESDED